MALSRKKMKEIAQANIEKNLGNCDNPDNPEKLLDNVYVLAFDALVDAGAKSEDARHVALSFVAAYGRNKL